MALSASDAVRLQALQTAYDKLIAGDKRTRVTYGSTTIEYGQGDLTRLEGQIAQLREQDQSCRPKRGALRFRIL